MGSDQSGGFGGHALERRLRVRGKSCFWLAVDQESGRRVVLEIFDGAPDLAAYAQILNRTNRLAAIQHTGLVRCQGILRDGERVAVVFECLEGASLDRVLTRGRLDRRASRAVVQAASSALGALHGEQLLHAALAPETIVLGAEGRTTVRDPLIWPVRPLRGRCDVSGRYLAPERFLELPTVRTDVYSLGALAYHVLTGFAPFAGEGVELLRAHARTSGPGGPDPRDLDPPVLEVITRAMSVDPEARQASADAFAAELREALDRPAPSRSPVAPPRTPADALRPASPPPGRRGPGPLVLGVGAAAAALLLAAVLGLLLSADRGAGEASDVRSAPPIPALRPATTGQRRSTPDHPRLLGAEDRRALARLTSGLDTRAELAVGDLAGGRVEVAGGLDAPYAWSSIKPVIVARLLRDEGGPQGLTERQRGLARSAITASDNAAAARLFADLEERHGGVAGAASAITDVLRSGGDTSTTASTTGREGFSTYGQTLWGPQDQVRFLQALGRGCLLDASSTDYLLALMGNVVPAQRWGLGATSAAVAFKGGWGPDPGGGYLVRQMGLLRVDGRRVAVSLAVRPRDGRFGTGVAQITTIASWLTAHLGRAAAARPC